MCESTRESGESSLNRQIKRRLKRTIFYSLFEEAKAYAFFLRSWRRGSFAQEGEDRFLLEYFGSKTGIYVDVGANHPFVISNTYLLYKRMEGFDGRAITSSGQKACFLASQGHLCECWS